jgi:hypothetical protein
LFLRRIASNRLTSYKNKNTTRPASGPLPLPPPLPQLLHEEDVPFLIREHARKFQWGISHATVWQLQPAAL